jgi:phenylpyruvate tautomerase PptA (4-oxalocrotonate tautomerase family)
MPLVRIDLRQGKTPEYRRKIGEMVYRAMLETIKMPEHDRFQVITDHPEDRLIYDPSYLGINRTDDIVFIEITLNAGRTLEQKKALYARVVELLGKEPGIRPEDVFINLVECAKEDWSFGNGNASYASGGLGDQARLQIQIGGHKEANQFVRSQESLYVLVLD